MAESITADDINNALEEVYLHKHIVDKTPNCSIEEAVKRRDNLKEIWAIENPHGNMLELNQLALSEININYSQELQKALTAFRECHPSSDKLLSHDDKTNQAIQEILGYLINQGITSNKNWDIVRIELFKAIEKKIVSLLYLDVFYYSELLYISNNIIRPGQQSAVFNKKDL